MNELQIFTHPDFGSLEVWIGPDGKPWFPATESAMVLKYANPQEAVRDHCIKAGCAFRSVSYPSGTKQKKYINRPNLSRLIARSKLPEAAKFESWIFDDVLESVFDHGGYLTPAKMEEALLNPDVLIQLATNLKAEQAKRRMLEVKVAEDAPKVLFADSVAASEDSILIGKLAKLLCQSGVKTGQNRLFEQLRQDGYLCSAYGERRNTPTQKAVEQGLFEVQTHVVQDGDDAPRTRYTTKVTGKGQVYFMNKYGNLESQSAQ